MAKLDDITIGNYQVLATNITRAYIPYYKNLASVYSDTSKGTGKVIREQQIRMADMLGLLARVEGRGATPVTRKELKNLENLRSELYKTHDQVSIWVKESIPFRKDSEKAIKDIGISPKDMKAAAEVSKRPGLERGGAITQLIRSLRLGTAGLGVAMAGAVIRPMLGPLAAPAAAAAGLGYSAYRMARGVRGAIGRRRARLAGGDVPSAGVAGMPAVSGLADMPGLTGTGVVEGIASTYPRDDQGRFVPRGGLTGIDNIEKGLFKFFNIRALKAKWTRRLLRAVEKGEKGTGTGLLTLLKSPGVLIPLAGAIGSVLMGLATSILGAAVAYVSFRVGKDIIYPWLEKKITPWFDNTVYPWLEKLVYETIPKIITWVTELPGAMKESILTHLEEAGRKFKGVLNAIIAALKNVPSRVGGWMKEAVLGLIFGKEKEEVVRFGEFGGGKDGEFRGKGAGGVFGAGAIITKPTLGVVGDAGPEAILPLESFMDRLDKGFDKLSKVMEGAVVSAPIDTFRPPFDLADPLLNQLNRTGSFLSMGY